MIVDITNDQHKVSLELKSCISIYLCPLLLVKGLGDRFGRSTVGSALPYLATLLTLS